MMPWYRIKNFYLWVSRILFLPLQMTDSQDQGQGHGTRAAVVAVLPSCRSDGCSGGARTRAARIRESIACLNQAWERYIIDIKFGIRTSVNIRYCGA